VPNDVCVATDARVGMGNVSYYGSDHGGVDVDYEDTPTAEPTNTRLLLRADVGVGEVRVTNSLGEFYFDEHEFGPFRDNELDPDVTPSGCLSG
jgi:hypothetical protein